VNNILFLILGLAAGAAGYHLYDLRQYPVLSETCWKQDGNCSPYAKHTSWQVCQSDMELGNMRCDRSAPGQVLCSPAPDALVVGQCVNRWPQ
jgi:hypothetical protein